MSGDLIDVNVSLSRWLFRRLRQDSAAALVARLRERGVTQAWAGSFEALLHEDVAGVNLRLASLCKRHGDGMLVPFGAVNPMLSDWEEDLRRCHEVHKMPGIRLHPNYHQYALDHPKAVRLLEMAAERGLLVQIPLLMEDERTQHPLVQVPHVNAAPLVDLVKRLPKLRVVLLNWHRALRGKPLLQLIAAERVWFDMATVEGMDGVNRQLKEMPRNRLLFGSNAPLFILESALLKLRETGQSADELAPVMSGNAAALLKDWKPAA